MDTEPIGKTALSTQNETLGFLASLTRVYVFQISQV